jgi:predicted AlkP superfamily phosphohydrolase/phosphomutase
LFPEVRRKEEVYHGPHIDLAPDLIYRTKEFRFISNTELGKGLFLAPSWKYGTGTHRLEGVLFASGKHMRRAGAIGSAKLEDICPTILYLFDEPIPDNMDGRVVQEMINDDLLGSRPPRTRLAEPTESRQDEVYSESEVRGIEDRLRGLGYIE